MLNTDKEIYQWFSRSSGSEHIASWNAIKGLSRVLKRHAPTRLLEIGAGIGTLTYIVLASNRRKRTVAEFTVFEDNSYCINSLKKNLSVFENQYTLVNNLTQDLNQGQKYDFIIVDGGPPNLNVDKLLSNYGIVFLEGNRSNQREIIESQLINWTRMDYLSLSLSSKSAYCVYFKNPTKATKIKAYLTNLYFRIKSSIKYRIKGFKRRIERTG